MSRTASGAGDGIDIRILHGPKSMEMYSYRSAIWSIPGKRVRGGPLRLAIDMPSGSRPWLLAGFLGTCLAIYAAFAWLLAGTDVAPVMRVSVVPLLLAAVLAVWRQRSTREVLEIDSRLVADYVRGDMAWVIPRTQFVNLRTVTTGLLRVPSIAWGGDDNESPFVGAGIGSGLRRSALEAVIARIEEFYEQVPAEPIE